MCSSKAIRGFLLVYALTASPAKSGSSLQFKINYINKLIVNIIFAITYINIVFTERYIDKTTITQSS